MVDGDGRAVHDKIVIPHQASGLVGLENVGFDKVNPVVVQPSDDFASPGLVGVPDGDPGDFIGLKEIKNRFAAYFTGSTETEYFHWERVSAAFWPLAQGYRPVGAKTNGKGFLLTTGWSSKVAFRQESPSPGQKNFTEGTHQASNPGSMPVLSA